MTGIGHPVTLWRKVQAGTFPKPIQISPRRSAWVESEVVEWIRARIAAGPARIAPPGRPTNSEVAHEAA
jgi:prophage regulatory protein